MAKNLIYTLFSRLSSGVEHVILIRYMTPTSETIIKQEAWDQTETNKRFIDFKDHQMTLDKDYYYNNKQ